MPHGGDLRGRGGPIKGLFGAPEPPDGACGSPFSEACPVLGRHVGSRNHFLLQRVKFQRRVFGHLGILVVGPPNVPLECPLRSPASPRASGTAPELPLSGPQKPGSCLESVPTVQLEVPEQPPNRPSAWGAHILFLSEDAIEAFAISQCSSQPPTWASASAPSGGAPSRLRQGAIACNWRFAYSNSGRRSHRSSRERARCSGG